MIDRHDDVNVLEGMYPLREHDTTFHLKVCRDNDRDQDKSMSFTAWEVQQPAMLGKYCSQQGKSVKMQWLGCWTLNQQLTTKTVSSELWLFALNFVERNDIFTWTHRPIITLCKVFPIAQHCTIWPNLEYTEWWGKQNKRKPLWPGNTVYTLYIVLLHNPPHGDSQKVS